MTEWNRWPTSARPMGIGIMVPIAERSAFGPTPPRVRDMVEMAQTAEAIGCDAIWLADHFLFRPPVAPEGEEYGLWEAWTAAAALAQATSKIQIGLLVTCLGWRNPGIVARMTETIEDISNGRFILGVGAGWHEPEYDAYGMPFDHRASRFEDSITILSDLLRTGKANHQGKFFSAITAINQPRGPRADAGGPPILVGTGGKRMLRLTATYADAWNTVWHSDPAATKEPLAKLEAACAEVGRDPKTITQTAGGNIELPGSYGARPNCMKGTPEQIAERLSGFRDLGFSHFVAGIDPCTPKSIENFKDVVDALDETAK
jgi:alkanesulfonate monooxygenase SsuD/methylene tetrahydromethanopterin reductase-like flavin-dependent oxidoreductase (luciferase family)